MKRSTKAMTEGKFSMELDYAIGGTASLLRVYESLVKF